MAETLINLNSSIDAIYPVWSRFLRLRYDHFPSRNAQNIPVDSILQFTIYNPDSAFGIDITTFKIRINEGEWYRYGDSRLTFTEISYKEILVYFNPPDFDYDSQKSIEVYCEDNHNNPGIKLEIL